MLADHSHFESVIERLQQLAAQAKQEYNGNESNYVTGDEEVEQPTHIMLMYVSFSFCSLRIRCLRAAVKYHNIVERYAVYRSTLCFIIVGLCKIWEISVWFYILSYYILHNNG